MPEDFFSAQIFAFRMEIVWMGILLFVEGCAGDGKGLNFDGFSRGSVELWDISKISTEFLEAP